MAKKNCKKCNLLKSEKDDFYFHSTKQKYENVCKECQRAQSTANYHRNTERYSAYNSAKYSGNKAAYRDRALRRKFSITLEQYNQMWEAQNGLCAICGEGESVGRNGVRNQLAVDHNHETGMVRSLLCSNCNQGLGRFKDELRLVRLAVAYLEGHE